MILITGISIITAICVHGSSIYGSDVSQSLLRCIHYCAAFLIAYYSVRWFGKDTVRLIVISGLISYATVFIQYIQRAGLKGLIFFQHVVNGVGLEVHDLTYCMGLFFIYYLLSDEYSKSYKIKALIPISIAIIYGNKRSLFLGLAISILIYVLLNRFESQSLQLLWIVFGIYIVGAFIFLWLVKSGVFATILTYFNIPDMARLRIWNYFSDSYTLTPGYWGRGIAYTDNRMVLRETMQSLDITNKIPIHNDILRIYIGWGFIPFLYYLVNFFLLQIRWFRKQGDNNNGWQYFAIASCVYFINFFDNMITSVSFAEIFGEYATMLWNKMFRCSIIGKSDLFDVTLKIGEDELWMVDVLKKANNIMLIGTPLYYYRSRAEGASKGQVFSEAKMTDYESQKKVLKSINEYGSEALTLYAQQRLYYTGQDIMKLAYYGGYFDVYEMIDHEINEARKVWFDHHSNKLGKIRRRLVEVMMRKRVPGRFIKIFDK